MAGRTNTNGATLGFEVALWQAVGKHGMLSCQLLHDIVDVSNPNGFGAC